MIPLIFFVFITLALGSSAGSVKGSVDDRPYLSYIPGIEEILSYFIPMNAKASPRPPPTSVVDYCATVPADRTYDLPDDFDCHAFWRCEGSVPIWYQCPPIDAENRKVFNPPQQRCDPPWQYPCQGGGGGSSTPLTTVTTTTEIVTTPSTSTVTTEIPPTDPTGDGSTTPSSTVDPGECTDGDPPVTIIHICSHVPAGQIRNLPYYGECHTYWQCRGSQVCFMKCGYIGSDQLVFNPVLGRCDVEWHYPCDKFEPIYPPPTV